MALSLAMVGSSDEQVLKLLQQVDVTVTEFSASGGSKDALLVGLTRIKEIVDPRASVSGSWKCLQSYILSLESMILVDSGKSSMVS